MERTFKQIAKALLPIISLAMVFGWNGGPFLVTLAQDDPQSAATDKSTSDAVPANQVVAPDNPKVPVQAVPPDQTQNETQTATTPDSQTDSSSVTTVQSAQTDQAMPSSQDQGAAAAQDNLPASLIGASVAGSLDQLVQDQANQVPASVAAVSVNESLKIFPETLNDYTAGWKNPGAAFSQDLKETSLPAEFDENNSASLQMAAGEAGQPQTITFAKFGSNQDITGQDIQSVQLRVSLAVLAPAANDGAQIEAEFQSGANNDYSWVSLGAVAADKEISNAANGGFFLFSLPLPQNISDLENSKIKLSYTPKGSQGKIFLDALWLEVSYRTQESVLEPPASGTSQTKTGSATITTEIPAGNNMPISELSAPSIADLKILPTTLDNDPANNSPDWKDPGAVFTQDLMQISAANDFNTNNSATLDIGPSNGEAGSSKAITLTGFDVSADDAGKTIANLQLRVSLASVVDNNATSTAQIDVDYLPGPAGGSWMPLGFIDVGAGTSNAANGGFFLFSLPVPDKLSGLQSSRIRFSYSPHFGDQGKVYLDSAWLEASFMGAHKKPDNITDNAKKIFKKGEVPSFIFPQIEDKRNFIQKIIAAALNQKREVSATLVDPAGDENADGITIQGDTVSISDAVRKFRPGLYTLKLKIRDASTESDDEQQFDWGVLTVNTDKSIYLAGDTANIAIGVLNDLGDTICDAQVELAITNPEGNVSFPQVTPSGKCSGNNVTDVPDYSAVYQVGGVGTYQMTVTANTDNGTKEITDSFTVNNLVPFDVQRSGPTRINPVASYQMKLTVTPSADYYGEVIETVPAGFDISEITGGNNVTSNVPEVLNLDVGATNDEANAATTTSVSYVASGTDALTAGSAPAVAANGDIETITWQVDWEAGETYELGYTFKAPNISPYIFLLGPLVIGDSQETRQWQIASDACDRTASVSGNWSSTATWGGSSVPISSQGVCVNAGIAVTVDTAAACASITFNAVTTTSSITISGTNSLTVGGAISMPYPSSAKTCTLAVGAGTLSAASLAMSSTTGARYDTLSISTGTATISGNITTAGVASRIIFTGAGILNAGGTFMSGTAGTFTSSIGTVNFNAAGAQSIAPFAYTFNNVTLSGSGAKTLTNATINGILSMEGTATASGTVTAYGASSTLQYKGTGAQTPGTEFPATWSGTGGVIIANTSGNAVTLGAAKTFNGPLTIKSGATLNTGASNWGVTLGSHFSNSGTFTANVSSIIIAGTANQSISGFTTTGLCSMTKTGGIATLTGNVSCAGITINGSGGTLDLGTSLSHTISSAVTLTAGTLDGDSSTLTVSAGNWINNGGTFTPASGTVTFTSTGGAQAINGSATSQTFFNLTVNKTGQTLSVGGSTATLNINGTLTLTAGTFDAGTAAAINLTGTQSWLSGYGYRASIPISATAAGAQASYTVSLAIDNATAANTAGAIHCNTHAVDLTKDIRFTKSDGVTPLNFYRESATGPWWVQLDSIPASGDAYFYVYYGKAADTDASNGTNAFLFFDDFENGNLNKWSWNDSATYFMIDSSVKYEGGYSLKQVANASWYTLGKTLTLGNHLEHTRFKASTTANTSDFFYPNTVLQTTGAIGLVANSDAHYYYSSGSWLTLPVDTTYDTTSWHVAETAFDITNSAYRWWIDGASKGSATMNDENGNAITGFVALSMVAPQGGSAGTFNLDQYWARNYVYPEPVWDTPGAQETSTVTSNWTNNGGTFTPGTGTVTFNSTSVDQNINGSASSQTLNNLTINKSGYTLNVNGSTTSLTTNGTLTLTAGNFAAPATVNLAGLTLTSGIYTAGTATNLSGNYTNNGGTFTGGSTAFTINGTAATQSIAGFTTTGLVSMTKTSGTATLGGNVGGAGLTINGSGGTLNLGTGLTHTFTGVVTLTAGTLNGGSSTLNENATSATAWNGTGSLFTCGTGTVSFGGVAQTLSATATTFNNLTFAGSGTKTLGSATTVSGTITIGSGVTLSDSAGNYGITVAGNWTNSGGTFTPGTDTVTFNGAGGTTQAISGNTSFYNFTAAAAAARTLQFAAGSATTVTHNWTITGAASQLITLTSSTTSAWTVNPTNPAVSYVDVSYSTNSATPAICATYSQSTHSGNTNWTVTSGSSCASNTAPTFNTGYEPHESPVSDSSTPTNVGANVTFKATANDTEHDSWYLAVCRTNAITPGTGGGAPTCVSVPNTWAISTLTTYNSEASVSYTVTSSETNQTYAWYAFACDNNSSGALCSAMSNTGASGTTGASPFSVNHAPTFTASSNNGPANPGGSVTVTVTTAQMGDGDTDGSQDTLTLYVCPDSGFTSGASPHCTNTQLCSSSAVNPTTTSATCNISVPNPQAHGTVDYYPFIVDNHGFASAGAEQGYHRTYTVNDVVPTVSGTPTLNGSATINLTAEKSTTNITIHGIATDDNGCADLVAGSTYANLWLTSFTNASCVTNAGANANKCYYHATCSADGVDTCLGGTDKTVGYNCAVAVQYYADPTDSGSPWSTDSWTGTFIPGDGQGVNTAGQANTATQKLNSYLAMDLASSYNSIAYGSVSAGTNMSTLSVDTRPEATGNVAINTNLSGTTMTGPGTAIPIAKQKYSSVASTAYASGTALSGTPTLLSLGVCKSGYVSPSGTPANKDLWWGIAIPSGQTSGAYTGTDTITAVEKSWTTSGDWCEQ